MKRSIILAALVMSMAVTVFAEEELIWEEQAATEDVAYAFEEEETTSEEQIASEAPEYVFEEPDMVEEQTTEEEVAGAEIAFDENVEESVYEEQIVTEETASSPVAIEGLVYTGLPQALITPQPGDWSYSLDGETYSNDLPVGLNAGTYTVYMKEGDSDPVVITVCIAKADVVSITHPVAATDITTNEEGPADASDAASVGEEKPAYAAGEEPDEVVFEDLS